MISRYDKNNFKVFQPSTTPDPTNGTTTPWVTVLPNNSDPAEWFEKNPVLASAIIIGGFLLILVVVLFCWIRYKRKKWERKQQAISECSESEIKSGSTTPRGERKGSSVSEILGDSFVIIQTPLSKRRESKHSRTLAMPMFSVNQRKPSRPNPGRRATVHFARWSDEGMEITSAGMVGKRARTSSVSSRSEKFSRSKSTDTTEKVEMPSSQSGSSTSPINNGRLVFRRISEGRHHAIYAPEILKSGPGQLSKEV